MPAAWPIIEQLVTLAVALSAPPIVPFYRAPPNAVDAAAAAAETAAEEAASAVLAEAAVATAAAAEAKDQRGKFTISQRGKFVMLKSTKGQNRAFI